MGVRTPENYNLCTTMFLECWNQALGFSMSLLNKRTGFEIKEETVCVYITGEREREERERERERERDYF